MNSALTALTRPRISSGVCSCTSEKRMTTLTTSACAEHEQCGERQRQPRRDAEHDGGDAEGDHGGEQDRPDAAA